MEKSFSFKIEEMPITEGFNKEHEIKFFTDTNDLSEKFKKIDSGDSEETNFFNTWAENIDSEGASHRFDTILETIFLTESEDIKSYFEITEDDKGYLEDLNITNQKQHKKLVYLYDKIQIKFKELILKSIENKQSRDFLLLLITEYNKTIERKADFFIEKIEEYKKEFNENLVSWLGKDSEGYDLDKIKKIINQTQVNFIDPLGLKNYEGSVDPDHAITMSLRFGPFYTNEEELEDTESEVWDFRNNYINKAKYAFFHELLHIISSNRKRLTKDTGDGIKRTSIQSTGLVFEGNKQRFNWLNEALTEIINLDTNNEENIDSYLNEIRLYELLIKKTLDSKAWRDLMLTYFFNVRKDDIKGLDEWKENRKRIDESFGPNGKNFLVKLDNWIEENGGMPDGVKKAYKIISQWEDGKPRPEDFLSKTP
jgi:hypothetical protein